MPLTPLQHLNTMDVNREFRIYNPYIYIPYYRYESQLVDPSLHEYGKVLFSRYDLTIKQLLRVTKHDGLLDHHQVGSLWVWV